MSVKKTTKRSTKKSSKKSTKRTTKKAVGRDVQPTLFDKVENQTAEKEIIYKGTHPAFLLVTMALAATVVILTVIILRNGISFTPESQQQAQTQKAQIDAPKTKNTAPQTKLKDEKKAELVTKESELDASSKPELPEKKTVFEKRKVYFLFYDESSDTISYKAVSRNVDKENSYTEVLRQLFDGPLSSESAAGLETSLSSYMKVKKVTVKDGLALVDLDTHFSNNSYGDIGLVRINQVYYTMVQYPSVKGIVITINGKLMKTTEDGHALNWPLTHKL